MKSDHSKQCKTKSNRKTNCTSMSTIRSGIKISPLIFFYVFALVISQSRAGANSLEDVDDKELAKLINQEQYVAVLFSKYRLLNRD